MNGQVMPLWTDNQLTLPDRGAAPRVSSDSATVNAQLPGDRPDADAATPADTLELFDSALSVSSLLHRTSRSAALTLAPSGTGQSDVTPVAATGA